MGNSVPNSGIGAFPHGGVTSSLTASAGVSEGAEVAKTIWYCTGDLMVHGNGMRAGGAHDDDGSSRVCNLSGIEPTFGSRTWASHGSGRVHARFGVLNTIAAAGALLASVLVGTGAGVWRIANAHCANALIP